MKGTLGKIIGTGMLLMAAAAMPALGQVGGGGGGQGGGGGGGGGGFGGGRGGGGRGGRGGGAAQFQQQRMQQIQQQIGATDEDWAAIQPKVEAVMTAQRDVQAGGMRGFGGRGGRGGFGGGAQPTANQSEVQAAQAALQQALDNKDSPPELIKEKLQALRDARARAREVLKKAQTDLQALLTQRQEAVMVELGILE
ncbi:MAG TPA: hypothetical protein VH253_00990 [Phycisphaerae bacterium]|nr:hypothetical protein [Phycisphaerae bacterium]